MRDREEERDDVTVQAQGKTWHMSQRREKQPGIELANMKKEEPTHGGEVMGG
jgi:hypothetical protein